jgi:[acyl-carrier-protein] S-malonyltransferase
MPVTVVAEEWVIPMSVKKRAYIFPGQGAQYVGMGRELYENAPQAKAVFDKADAVLGFSLSKLCFEGPIEKLTQSAVCQPAILTLSIAAFEVIKHEPLLKTCLPAACAGLSLGEYSALVAGGSLRFEDAVLLVHKRGQFMDEASRNTPGAMVCVIGIGLETAQAIAQTSGAEIANLNCPGQIVFSGTHRVLAEAGELAQQSGAKRVIQLDVNGPFHSSLMLPAAEKLGVELAKISIKKPDTLFVPNVTAEYVSDPEQIKELLIKQVAKTTYWEKSVLVLQNSGFAEFWEVGPGKVLRGLLQRIDKQLVVANIEKWADVVQLKENRGGQA